MQIQRMTVFDLPMSYVYGGVALRLLPDARAARSSTVWRNARDGWRAAHDDLPQQIVGRLRQRQAMTILVFVFLLVLLVGVPVFIALAGSSLHLHALHRRHSRTS